jgi:hypothetical protein
MSTHKVVRNTERTTHGVVIGSPSSQIVHIGSEAECWATYRRLEEERDTAAQGPSLRATLQRAVRYAVERVGPGDTVHSTPAQ